MNWRDTLWHIVHVAAQRVVPLLLAGLVGILADAGLLDGQLSDAAQELKPSASSSSPPAPTLSPGPKTSSE